MFRLSKLMPRLVISLLVFSFFLLNQIGLLPWRVMDRMENFFYDARVNLTLKNTVDKRIVIVDIDEASLVAEGQWPWSRDKLAALVDTLFNDYGVRVMGFDMVFAEADDRSALNLLDALIAGPFANDIAASERLATMRANLNHDERFAKSLAGQAVILGYVFKPVSANDALTATLGALPSPVFSETDLAGLNIPFITQAGYTGNLPELQDSAATGGFFDNPLVSEDGVFRQVPLMQIYDGEVYESLALAVARRALDGVRPGFSFASTGRQGLDLEFLTLGERSLPVDEQVSVLVPYRGKQGSFPYVSAASVLDGSADIETLFDSIVLLGTTAPGLLDLRSTPVGNKYAGVEVHANVVSGILDERFKYKPNSSATIELLTMLTVGLLFALVLPLLSPAWQFLLLIASVTVGSLVNLWFWQVHDYVIPLAAPLLFTLLLFILQTSYGYIVESKRKRRLSRLFGQYIPPELVTEMDMDDQELSLKGESREMSVLFSDVRGFTTISESLVPTELTRLMNHFLTPVTRVIHEHRGTIDKYMGDAVMAFWGAPLTEPQHANAAIAAGLNMLATLDNMASEFKANGWPEIKMGVGVNSGDMNVGNMGSEFRMAYTVLGDAVNLGSRLEGLTKQYGLQILCSEMTKIAAVDYFYREIDCVQVKGRDEPVTIFEPIGLIGEVTDDRRKDAEQFAAALALYRARDWDAAEQVILGLQALRAELLYEIYLERIGHFRLNPPGNDWQGVWAHQSK